ncbi:M48 family metalloprotease [bacterium]|nr:M48 family metalloprotease [bacterium]
MIIRVLSISMLSLFLAGCKTVMETVNDTSGVVADKVAPVNVVTGERKLGIVSIEKSFQEADKRHEQLATALASADSEAGPLLVAVLNGDSELLSKAEKDTEEIQAYIAEYVRANRIIKRIAQASHYPDVDWVVHIVPDKTPNAFNTGGRHAYVNSGLYGGLVKEDDDNELAAVLAHEMAHAVCGHIGERDSLAKLSRVSKRAKKIAQDDIAAASFSTEQEDEADRVGLLYMSLAGFDPMAAPRIWQGAHEKYGSNPGAFTYDHSLNADRAGKTKTLAEKVYPYYRESPDTVHPNVKSLLSNNAIYHQRAQTSGFVGLLEAAVDLTVKYHKTKIEAENRKEKKEAEGSIPKNRPVYITNNSGHTLHVYADFYVLDEDSVLEYDKMGSEGKYFIVPNGFSGVLGVEEPYLAAAADVWAYSADGRYKWKPSALGMDQNRQITNSEMRFTFRP